MQNTSALWKQLWAGGNAWLETVAVIAGTEYSAITSPVISRALMQGGLSVGNTVSATCSFTVRTSDAIPKSAEVRVRMRLSDGTSTSEWLPAGTFYISHRAKDAVTGLVTLECYDALLKANATYTPAGTWPRSMAQAASEIAAALGVTMDGRTSIRTGSAYMLDEPEDGATLNDLLRAIAMANGGNWIVTPAGKLRLVPLVSCAGAASATSNAIEAAGVTGSLGTSTSGTITGVRCKTDDGEYLAGNATGLVIDVEATVPVVLDLADWMVGLTYQAFDMKGAVYDPAVELGDYVNRLSNVHSVLLSESATLGLAFRGDIAAPEPGELADEYPYIGGSAKVLQVAKAYAKKCTEELDSELDQEEVFNRLTDDGAVQGLYMLDDQLYVNASYIRSGLLAAQYIDAAHLHVNAANVDGTLTIGQLPDTVAEESDIPTNVSDLTNDSGFQNATQVTTITNNTISTTNVTARNLHVKAVNIEGTLTIGQLPDTVAEESDIPTNVSDLTNDSGFQNSTQVTTIAGNVISTAQLNANNITSGTLSASRIAANSIGVGKLSGSISGGLSNSWVLDLTNGEFTIGNISADSITAGSLSADRISGGTLTLGGNNNTNGALTVKDSGGTTIGSWNMNGITAAKGTIGSFTLSSGAFSYGSLAVGGTGAYIGTGGIIYNEKLSSRTAKTQLFAQGVDFYSNGTRKTRLIMSGDGLLVSCYDENNALTHPFQVYDTTNNQNIYLRYNANCQGTLNVTGKLSAYTSCQVYGDFSVNGTKSRRVDAGEYGERLLYCYETPSPMFGDVGEGVIGEDGRCYVWLDPVLAEAISAGQYQVFLQRYGAGDCYVAERRAGCFVVEGAPGLAFGWELKAKQGDFDQLRLERWSDGLDLEGADYGELALQYIEGLKKERVSA